MARRIALVEDEPDLRDNYCAALRKQGYEVTAYGDRDSALAGLDRELPDLVILDVGLGSDSEAGFEICRQLRARSGSLPIIFLTALDSDLDTISGLRLGADDYLTKDISLPHLLARIGALFRRVSALQEQRSTSSRIERGALTIDPQAFRVYWQGELVDLTLTEYWIVVALANHPGHVKSREQLMADARAVVDDSTVTSHIKRLRRKFESLDPGFDCIDTVYGMGYRWNPGDA